MAAGSYERKVFVGGAPERNLVGAITDVATTLVIDDATGWPGAGKFVITVDAGLANEEKMLVSAIAGTTLTIETRGYDDTTGIAHADGAKVTHTLDASTVDQVNRLANLLTARGDLIVRDGTNPIRVAGPAFSGAGNDEQDNWVLLVDHDETAGVKYAILQTVEVGGTPDATKAIQFWLDTGNDGLLRASNGTAWLIPGIAPVVADEIARTALFGDPPSSNAVCWHAGVLEVYNSTEVAWIPMGRRDEAIPKVADEAARDVLYPTPTDGVHVYVLSSSELQEYRTNEWVRINFKVTVSETAPSNPQNGDVWIQPT